MAGGGGFVEIDGPTPAGAACAATLARAGVPVYVRGSALSGSDLALVSAALLEELQIAGDVACVAVGSVVDRHLGEDDARDEICGPGDAVILRRSDLVAALMERATAGADPSPNGSDRPIVRIDAGEIRLGNSMLVDDDRLPLDRTCQSVQIIWETRSTAESAWIRMTGDPLAETKATASLLVTGNAAALTVEVPTRELIATSTALPDVIARLLAHPAVDVDFPRSEPTWAVCRLLSSTEIRPFDTNNGKVVRIGAVGGLADSLHLDRELTSAIAAAEVIADGIKNRRLSTSYLSRISREWRKQGLLEARSR